MTTSALRIQKELSKASSGTVKASANGQPTIDTTGVIFTRISQGNNMIMGNQHPSDYVGIGFPKVTQDGNFKFNYPMDFEGSSYLYWDHDHKGVLSIARTGSITIEISDNQRRATGSFEFTAENSVEIKGTFNVYRDN